MLSSPLCSWTGPWRSFLTKGSLVHPSSGPMQASCGKVSRFCSCLPFGGISVQGDVGSLALGMAKLVPACFLQEQRTTPLLCGYLSPSWYSLRFLSNSRATKCLDALRIYFHLTHFLSLTQLPLALHCVTHPKNLPDTNTILIVLIAYLSVCLSRRTTVPRGLKLHYPIQGLLLEETPCVTLNNTSWTQSFLCKSD